MAKDKTTSQINGEPMEIDFIICDNTINRYGWRLLVEGIDITGFLKNPVACLQHNTWSPAIGKWKNVRVEDSQLKGTLEFDANDDEAIKLYNKYNNGYMNAVSLNVIPLVESDTETDLLPGQKYPTVIKSELLEVSLVTIPGQKNATRDVKLSNPDGTEYKLNFIKMDKTENQTNEIAQLRKEVAEQKQLNADNLIKLHQQRGVVSKEEAEPLKKLALTDYENTSKMLEARQTPEQKPMTTADEKLAESLVKLHFERGVITAEQKEFYLKSAKLDFEGTKKALEALVGKEVITGMQFNTNSDVNNDDRKSWTYLDYFKKDPQALSAMEKEKPDEYKKLCAYFEQESRKKGLVID